MPRRKRRQFKKIYKLKLIEHRYVQVEANTEQDAIDFAVGKIGRDYKAARQLSELSKNSGTYISAKDSVKLIKKTARVVSDRPTQHALEQKVLARARRERAKKICANCDRTLKPSHWYDRVTRMYYCLEGWEFHEKAQDIYGEYIA